MRTLQEQIGANVRALRERADLRQTELGQALQPALGGSGWTRQAVWQAEQGKRQFTAAELLALAHVLGVTVPQLLETDESVTLPSGKALSPEVIDGLTAAKTVDREQHLRVHAALRGLRESQRQMNALSMTQAVLVARVEQGVRGGPDVTVPAAGPLTEYAERMADKWSRPQQDLTLKPLGASTTDKEQ